MIAGRGRHRRKRQDVGTIVRAVRNDVAVAQDRRDEDHPGRDHPLVLQQSGENARPYPAVALPGEKERTSGTPARCEPESDELRNRRRVLPNAEIRLDVLLFRRAAVPRLDRIDEDQVGHVEKTRRVIDEVERRFGAGASAVAESQRFRAERPEVQQKGGRPGAAVERKGHGALALRRDVVRALVGDVEDARLFFLVLAEQGHEPRRRLVGDDPPPDIRTQEHPGFPRGNGNDGRRPLLRRLRVFRDDTGVRGECRERQRRERDAGQTEEKPFLPCERLHPRISLMGSA